MSGIINSAGSKSGVIGELGGGITHAQTWRLNGHMTNITSPTVITNWTAATQGGVATIGTSCGHSSGIFTFPRTGVWYIESYIECFDGSVITQQYNYIQTSVDNGNTFQNADSFKSSLPGAGGTLYSSSVGMFLFNVNSITGSNTCKARIHMQSESNAEVSIAGSSAETRSRVTFMRIG